jgi:glycosyltransferase involved in cell wall biosynthesis
MTITIAIPTLGRDEVLLNTISELLTLKIKANEIIIIDQTDKHSEKTLSRLNYWHKQGEIKWLRIQYKSITNAMNIALRKSSSDRVLFLDDDIIPDKNLVDAHLKSSYKYPYSIIAGRVLQPWHQGKNDVDENKFLFNSLKERELDSFMGGNVLIPRIEAINIGGFDTNFIKVAYHFEAEFAYRWKRHGYSIFYAPDALIHHLKTERGGTRSYGNHLTTIKPDHSVGRHYFYFCRYSLGQALQKSLKDISRSILTKHHLRNPLYVPSTLISEFIGLVWAFILKNLGKGTIKSTFPNLLIISSHPIQYYSPIFSSLDQSHDLNSIIYYLSLPDSKSQSLGFNQNFTWDIPLLQGYNYRFANSSKGRGLFAGFFGVRLKHPITEIKDIKSFCKPDAALITGWHFWGMVQAFTALKLSNIPLILRMDSNSLHNRNFILRRIYKIFFSWVDICLCVGKYNQMFCEELGFESSRIIRSPHVVDNDFFLSNSEIARQDLFNLRKMWKVPTDSFCFLFAGKLQSKKRPLDLLLAYREALLRTQQEIYLLIVGTGPLEEECKSFSQKYHLPISYVGFLNQTEIPKAYAVSDCIVLPSDQGETWGLVVNEAMACGLPAIASDYVGCVPDLVIDGETGFTYKCGDYQKLAEHLVYLAEHNLLAKKMGLNAQKLVHDQYSLKKVTESIKSAMVRISG